MANADNLRVPTTSEARERGKKGGQASGEARRRRQQMRGVIQSIFDGHEYDVDGATLTAEQALAATIMKVALDVSHKNWFDTIQLLVRATESDRSEIELELLDEQVRNQLDNIRDQKEFVPDETFTL